MGKKIVNWGIIGTGKAYSEDLIHSFLLRQFGVSLLVNMKAICMTHLNLRLSKFVSDFKAKRYFAKLENLSLIRMIAYYIIQIALLTIFAMTNIKKTVNKPS